MHRFRLPPPLPAVFPNDSSTILLLYIIALRNVVVDIKVTRRRVVSTLKGGVYCVIVCEMLNFTRGQQRMKSRTPFGEINEINRNLREITEIRREITEIQQEIDRNQVLKSAK